MSDLSEFLLARIAEDEAVARAATPSPWVPDDQGWVDSNGEWIICAPYHDLDISDEDAEHVTRWQPARVLAECEAKRRIVELHATTVTEDWVNPTDGPAYRDDDHSCAICGWFRDACDTVKQLALPYADHADYDQAWRP